jgi:hypothetical protein
MVLRVCFFLVFVAVGRTATRRTVASPISGSAWIPRTALPRDAYSMPFASPSPDAASGAWMADYVRWARATDNRWALSLLPYLAVLRLLGGDDRKSPERNIYTLF